MGFYDEISKYYDYIFPVGKPQLNFIKESAGLPPKSILDVACGSGGYSVELAKSGYLVSAIDIDDEMVNKAKEKARREGLDINVLKSDMRDIRGSFREKFHLIFCIGNSIVHLGSLDEILDTLKQMRSQLEAGGSLVLQTINYDRVIKFNVNELPTIKNDDVGLEFIRKYRYDKQQKLINFDTVLTVNRGSEKEVYENSINLLPVMSADMERVLTQAGFGEIKLYGDFNRSPYDENSFMLVVKAKNQ